MSPRNWLIRIDDMLLAIERIGAYIGEMTQSEFENDPKTIDAVLRNLEIIGEAARNLPLSVVRRYPNIPWHEIRAIRNIVVHEYFGVSLNIIWHTTQVDLPAIVPVLKSILSENSD
ncbi:MAG: DUF86 domain-containing protein [Anaerolineales bacterium]